MRYIFQWDNSLNVMIVKNKINFSRMIKRKKVEYVCQITYLVTLLLFVSRDTK